MNLVKEQWTCQEYEKYLVYLHELAEEKYQEFSQKLTPTKYKILGIRMPKQRKIAKEIIKGNYQSFLQNVLFEYFEEVNIYFFVLAYVRDFSLIFSSLSYLDNWSTCDSLCSTLKLSSNELEKYFPVLCSCLEEKEEYHVRFGIVMLLQNYLCDDYIQEVLKLLFQIKREEYYIFMGQAWCISECFIQYPLETMPYLQKKCLNAVTQNKAIQKIRESWRVTPQVKKELQAYRM